MATKAQLEELHEDISKVQGDIEALVYKWQDIDDEVASTLQNLAWHVEVVEAHELPDPDDGEDV